MRKLVTVILKSDRVVRLAGEVYTMPANTVLTGQLSFDPSDGPRGEREFDHPSFLSVCFDFEFAGRPMRYAGFLGRYHLWAPNGTQTTFEDPTFISECGVIDGMMDDRRDWFYIRADGVRHTNRLKYTSCHFELMLKSTALQVKCRYYDQNPDICGYVTIYYSRDLDELLFFKDMKFYYDQAGKVEDFLWDEGPHVTLVEPDAAANHRRAGQSSGSGESPGDSCGRPGVSGDGH